MRPQPRPQSFFWPEGSREATLQDLLEKKENARDPGKRPSGNTYGNLAAGMTQLGQGIAHRVATNRQNRLNQQIEQIDPTGEIVRALMRGRQ
jgi:hypothetical protein